MLPTQKAGSFPSPTSAEATPARDMDLGRAIQLAGTFLEAGLADTVREKIPRNDGINYEKYLALLIPEEHQQAEKEADPHEI